MRWLYRTIHRVLTVIENNYTTNRRAWGRCTCESWELTSLSGLVSLALLLLFKLLKKLNLSFSLEGRELRLFSTVSWSCRDLEEISKSLILMPDLRRPAAGLIFRLSSSLRDVVMKAVAFGFGPSATKTYISNFEIFCVFDWVAAISKGSLLPFLSKQE